MYYPILRGKQFELICLRELATIIQPNLFCPVIEPVRENLSPLLKTVKSLNEKSISPIIILNPTIGDFSSNNTELLKLTQNDITFTPCFKVKSISDLDILEKCKKEISECAFFIENGIEKTLPPALRDAKYTFVNKNKIPPGAMTQLRNLVLFDDCFDKKTRNADYEDRSHFSTLHLEWKLANAIGFGDYTILSEEYSESGGPAYVVTIHLSYIDKEEFDTMYVRHFSSFDDESPANPGGKFKDALNKVVKYNQENPDVFDKTKGLSELISLVGNPFPGLGQVKKYSIKHHVETVCNFIK